jgi:putative ABC transport system permease protein
MSASSQQLVTRRMHHGNISPTESLSTAIRSLRSNLLRSLLTTLGIIIGTGAVIAIIAITEGNSANISNRIGQLGPNTLVIQSQGVGGAGGIRTGASSAQSLTTNDIQTISAINHVVAVSPLQTAGANTQVVYQNQNWSTRIYGVYPGYQQIGSWTMAEGQWFDQTAEDQQSAQAVIGQTIVDQLFTPLGVDPLGQQIRISSQTFTIVGVLKAKGAATFGISPDDAIYVPFSTAQTRLVGARQRTISNIQVQVDNSNNVDQAQSDITTALEANHGTSGSQDPFTVRNQNQIVQTAQATAQTLTLLLVGIAGISLLVGGIGIMNIMLVTVTERTREIGIRIALGARQRDILVQFLIEATVLTAVGGLIGIGVGSSVGLILSHTFTWPYVFDPLAVALAFGVAAMTGIIFGFYPAQRAARMDPIEALRIQ